MLAHAALGEGTPLVLLPWFSLDSTVMAAAFEPAVARIPDIRRLYVDLPGTGGSPRVEPRSDAVLDSVAQTVDDLVPSGPFLLAGCSYGGYIAAGLARRMPDRVRALLLVCSGVKINPRDRNLHGVLPSTPEPGWLADVPPDLHSHFTTAVGHQTRAVAERMTATFAGNAHTDDGFLETLRATGYQLSDEGTRHQFDGEVVMLIGKQDRLAGHLDQRDALVRHYPNGRGITFDDAGHYLPFEQPESFAVAVRDWLARSR